MQRKPQHQARPRSQEEIYTPPDYAGILPRAAAFMIDFVLLSFLEALLLFGSQAATGGIVLLVLGAAYFWFCWVDQSGQTLGNRLMRIRVVKVDGGPLNTPDALLRYGGYLINMLLGLGWAWAIIDERRQGWHDKMARTIVINVPPASETPV
jgi:uncharacterized RDD family membrane protein YckC